MFFLRDVTIIIPIYAPTLEYAPWVWECLTSACKEGCSVVVWDDCSPIKETITHMLNDFKIKRGDRFNYSLGAENMGVSRCRNKLASQVRTPLFLPLDCDDTLEPGSINKMLAVYNRYNMPVYPDISKFGNEEDPHYRLQDFKDCEDLKKNPGIASVNILQSVEMWRSIGGWNEDMSYLEDVEYNVRLIGTYCAKHIKFPLVRWRIHPNQRTKTLTQQRESHVQTIMETLKGVDDMSCCGKKRQSPTGTGNTSTNFISPKTSSDTVKVITAQNVFDFPATQDGLVLVRYTGGAGKGRHYKDGRATGRQYRVINNGFLYVERMDVEDPDFVEVRPAVEQKVAGVPVVESPVARMPIMAEQLPASAPEIESEKDFLPMPLEEMSIEDMRKIELTRPQVILLRNQEMRGRKRSKFMTHFNGLLEKTL